MSVAGLSTAFVSLTVIPAFAGMTGRKSLAGVLREARHDA